jgi:hypothetical protein
MVKRKEQCPEKNSANTEKRSTLDMTSPKLPVRPK